MPTPDETPLEIRANMHMTGDDARLMVKLATLRTTERGKPITLAELAREAFRCYAEHKAIVL